MSAPTGPGAWPREEPKEGLPRRGKFTLQIRQLEKLQEAIEVARCHYRAQPSPHNEQNLQKLIDEGDALRFKIGFAMTPEKR